MTSSIIPQVLMFHSRFYVLVVPHRMENGLTPVTLSCMANSGLNVDLLILVLAFFIKLKALISISPIPINLASFKFVIFNILII
jgi:hypothetical protein